MRKRMASTLRRSEPKLEEIAAHQHFAAAECQEKRPSFCQFIEYVLDFCRGHFAVVVVIEVAVNATLVAAVSDVEVNGHGHT